MDINREELLKGYILKNNQSFSIYFWDTLINKKIYIGKEYSYEDAFNFYCRYSIKYYSDKDYLLPKFIIIRKRESLFAFQIKYKDKRNKWQTKLFYSAKSLQEVIEYRKQFIANLL